MLIFNPQTNFSRSMFRSEMVYLIIAPPARNLCAACLVFLIIADRPSFQTIDASLLQRENGDYASAVTSAVANNASSASSKTDAGKLQTRYTGLIRSDVSPEVARALGLNETYPGLLITEVIPGSPAEKAGIRGANTVREIEGEIVRFGGDIIVAVDGNSTAVKDRDAFLDYLANEKTFGDNITLTTIRDGNIRKANLTITQLPDYFWYTDPDEGIRIKYPSDWEVSGKALPPGEIVRFFSPEVDPETGDVTASVFLRLVPSGGNSLDELALREREGTPDTRLLDIGATELSGQQAYETVYYDYSANKTMKEKSVFTLKDDQVYIINYVARSI